MGARSGGEEWAAIAAVSGAPAPAGVRPRSLFWLCQKESAPRPVEEKKSLLVATLHVRAKLLYGGRREMVPAGLRWLPDGRGGVRYRLDGGFPRRGCKGQRGARTHLVCFSFRAFRCATRCRILRGSVSGSEKRSSSMRQPPRRGRRHPPRDGSYKLAEGKSVPEGRPKSALAPIRRPPSRGGANAPERV